MTNSTSVLMAQNMQSLQELLTQQIYFQTLLKNDMPNDIVEFDHVRMALEHNTYQQIEFQEFMEADNHEKKEELVDYLLFMLNKYIFLGIKEVDGSMLDMLWGNEDASSSAAASCYASIEQFDFIKLIREHCTFKPWKVRTGENCVETEFIIKSFDLALTNFRKLARMTFDNYYDLHTCIIKKLMINLDRQENRY